MDSKEKRAEEIIPFFCTHNCNNPNIFPIIRQTLENFQHSKTMSNVFSGKKLINPICQAPCFGLSIMQFKIYACRRKLSCKLLWKEFCLLRMSFKSLFLFIQKSEKSCFF